MEYELLVQRFQKRDIIAFEMLYDMYNENIRGVIQTIVRDGELAEELAQDVFAKVWNNSGSFNPSKGRFFTWMLGIARNAAIDKLRSKSYKTKKKKLPAHYFVDILEQADYKNDTVDTTGLKKRLLTLQTKCIQLIELLYFRGYTQREASEELDIPLAAVKTQSRDCISKLRENITLEWM
jgi:RNA polymerase sigma-70 factor (ECF subfamily)